MELPIISVIVVLYNDKRILACLNSLQNQTICRDSFEIIIVENGPNRKYQKITKKYGCRYFHSFIKNMSMARNIGLYHAMGTYVFFTDADCVADPLWLYNMLKCFGQKKGYAGFGGSIRRYMPQSSIERYGKNLARGQKDLQYLEHISHLPYIVLANAGFLKKNLIAVGGFDEDLISGGDVDICWKLGVKGYRIGICNTAVIYHKNRDTIKSYFKAYFRYAVYQSLLCKKYAKNKITINPYPWKLLCKALGSVIRFKIKNLRRFYDIIEAIAIISGDIYGAILFKVLYL